MFDPKYSNSDPFYNEFDDQDEEQFEFDNLPGEHDDIMEEDEL